MRISRGFFFSMSWELIDTLWNVNVLGDVILAQPAGGINRYIMECK